MTNPANIGCPILSGMNWKLLVNELMAAGVTQVQIAQECRCAQSSISDLRSGAIEHPRFEIGAKLVELHKKAIRRTKTAKAA
jgi:hypothetical protein